MGAAAGARGDRGHRSGAAAVEAPRWSYPASASAVGEGGLGYRMGAAAVAALAGCAELGGRRWAAVAFEAQEGRK